ncbi:MAG: O-antigen ligase family protein [Planctomycetes bacterium]|jgi:O-antigen ligase|nr:O-antigen ligase family protein [Planctomycetota bacterium]
MTKSSDIRFFQDWGRIGSVLIGAVALLLGIASARLVAEDGLRGAIWSVQFFGPDPAIVNDLPFLTTYSLGLIFFVSVFGFLVWVYNSGGVDRPLLGLLALSLMAQAIPFIHLVALFPLLFLLLARGAARKELPIPLTPLFFPLALILLSYATTGFQTLNFGSFLSTSLDHGMTMFMVILFPIILRTRRHIEIFFHLLLLMAAISVGVEFIQELLSFMLGVPVTFVTSSDNTMEFPFVGLLPRASGLMTHQNVQANAIGGIGLIAFLWGLKPKNAISRSRRVMYLSAFILIGIGVLLTTSRSGWLSFGVGIVLVPLVRWPKKAPTFFLILLAAFTIGWATGFIQAALKEVMALSTGSAEFRWKIDHIAVQAWLNSPWIGRGVFGVVTFFNPFQLKVHNAYLQALSSLGLFGVGAFLLFFSILTYRIQHRLRHLKDSYDRDLLLGFMFVGLLTATQSLFTMFLWSPFLWSCVGILECLVIMTGRPRNEPEPSDLIFLQQKNNHGT